VPVETYSKSLLTGKKTMPGIPFALILIDMSMRSVVKKIVPAPNIANPAP